MGVGWTLIQEDWLPTPATGLETDKCQRIAMWRYNSGLGDAKMARQCQRPPGSPQRWGEIPWANALSQSSQENTTYTSVLNSWSPDPRDCQRCIFKSPACGTFLQLLWQSNPVLEPGSAQSKSWAALDSEEAIKCQYLEFSHWHQFSPPLQHRHKQPAIWNLS